MSDEATDGTVGVDVLARLFSLTSRRIQQLAKDGIIPKGGRGRYPFAASIRGYIQFLQTANEGKDHGVVNPDRLNQFQRRAYYASEKLKLDLQVQSGELVERGQVERDYGRTFTILSQFLDILPDIIEREGVSIAVIDRLSHKLDSVRKELAEQLASFDTPAVDDASRESA